MQGNTNPARSIAMLIVRISMVAFGLSTISTLLGNNRWTLVICGGALAVNLVVMLIGAYIVAASRRGA